MIATERRAQDGPAAIAARAVTAHRETGGKRRWLVRIDDRFRARFPETDR